MPLWLKTHPHTLPCSRVNTWSGVSGVRIALSEREEKSKDLDGESMLIQRLWCVHDVKVILRQPAILRLSAFVWNGAKFIFLSFFQKRTKQSEVIITFLAPHCAVSCWCEVSLFSLFTVMFTSISVVWPAASPSLENYQSPERKKKFMWNSTSFCGFIKHTVSSETTSIYNMLTLHVTSTKFDITVNG